MTIFRRVMIAAVAGVLSASAATGQIREQQPAEFPPASYKGKQYVDSKGCVFIRAGIDGDVSWVPRVTRARKTICGFAPSLQGQQVAASAPAAAPQQVEQITVQTASVAAPAATAATAKPVRRAAAKPRRVAAPKPVRQVARKPVRQVAPQKTIATQRVAASGNTACPNASALGQQYLRPSDKLAVRCGPQSAPVGSHQGGVVAGAVVASDAPISVSAHRRIVPRHVAINRINTTNVAVPRGYKSVWEDGRLNPHRAEQTLAGRQQMLLVWTNTVPRRLIDRTSGEDVTASQPLVYPYIDADLQGRELGKVTIVKRNGQVMKRIQRNPGVPRRPVYSTRSAPKVQATPTLKPRVAAPAAKPKQAVGGKRFVQIGYFSTKAKADKAAQYLSGLGMRARIGTVRKGGKTYLAVQAGPFKSSTATQSALSRLRGVGYSGAVARN